MSSGRGSRFNNTFKKLADVDAVDLKGALKRNNLANDLLPPRPDDSCAGELGNRFSHSLLASMKGGTYFPSKADIAYVPKPGFTTRPAAVMTLEDRVVYDALIQEIRQPVEKNLAPAIPLWPRGVRASKRWREFEEAVLREAQLYVVAADITGFYESVDHQRLHDAIIKSTGKADIADAIVELLGSVLGTGRGLPQGIDASDVLATVYLREVDQAMTRAGYRYWRHGDDIRVSVSTFAIGSRALALLERELRNAALLLNGAKTKVVKLSKYEKELKDAQTAVETTRAELLQLRLDGIDQETLEATVKEIDAQLAWEVFYHWTVPLTELLGLLEGKITVEEAEVAAEVLRRTIAADPALGEPDALDKATFHARLVRALIPLTASKDGQFIDEVSELLLRHPDEVEIFCGYLASARRESPGEVMDAVEHVLSADKWWTGAELAWVIGVIEPVADEASATLVTMLEARASNSDAEWIARVAALRFLGTHGSLSHNMALRFWQEAPHCYRADILYSVAKMPQLVVWVDPFLLSAKAEPVYEIVVSPLCQRD